MNLFIRVHALKVDVQNQLLPRMYLHITQQHLFFCAIQIERQNRSVKRFFAHLLHDAVVVELDVCGRLVRAIHDGRYFARKTQTAARTRSLQIARIGIHFK